MLDLGAGIDNFLSVKRVDKTRHVIGVDMTAERIEKARAKQALLGVESVEFHPREIEHLPVDDESVDVVISNCIINLEAITWIPGAIFLRDKRLFEHIGGLQ
jgi:arsenite methyltransferase